MTQVRAVERILRAYMSVEGAGVRLYRAFGSYEVPQFDPFLMLDDFRAQKAEDYLAGFPTHPHRGIETVTYMLNGSMEHKDSMGNAGTIRAGDVQWMTAGSGIIHSEMPKPEKGQMGGFRRARARVVANIPYYITTPLILRLVNRRDLFEAAFLTVQREVAERLTAAPGGKT